MAAEILGGLAKTLFDAIVAVFDALISAATGGILTDFWSRLISGENIFDIIAMGFAEKAIEMIEETESTIISVVGELENRISAHFAELLGLTDIQKRLAESLLDQVEAVTAKWEAEAEMVESVEEAAARELARRTMEVIGERANLYLDEYSLWMARFTQLEGEQEKAYYETSITGMEMAQRMLDIDVSLIHDLAQERNVAAVIGMTTEVEESIKTADEWAREVAIKPLAYGDTAMRVLSEFLDMPVEEIKEQLRIYAQLQYEIAGDMAPKYTPGE